MTTPTPEARPSTREYLAGLRGVRSDRGKRQKAARGPSALMARRAPRALTPAQRDVLRFIRSCILAGLPPSVDEMCRHIGASSPNAVKTHLDGLIAKGYITVLAGVSRGIRLAGCRLRLEYDATAEGERLRRALEEGGEG